MELRPDTTLSNYRIVDKLGEGGMGVVWRAVDTSLDREVAIKVLPDEVAGDADRLARFEREAKVLATVNHPNVAAIYGLETAEGLRFITMEMVPGQTLSEMVEAQGRIDIDEVLDIARQIADGLDAAHEKGVVHRDLKPANVKITPDGQVKVLDFGLAKAYDSDGTASEISPELSASPTLAAATRTGMIMGTAAYMSPEQARGKPVDKRADIWAFGVVVFELLTGKRMFEGETVSDVLAAVLREDIPWDALPESTPPSVERMLRRCLERDPKSRLRDVGDAALELAATATEQGPVAQPEVAEGGSGLRLAAAVVAAITVTAIATWTLKPTPPPPISDSSGPPRTYEVDLGNNTVYSKLSPDGSKVAFWHFPEVVVYDLETGTSRSMIQTEGVRGYGRLDWTADSDELLVPYWTQTDQSQILALPLDGSPARLLPVSGAPNSDIAPKFGRSGTLLQATSTGINEIHLDGSDTDQIVDVLPSNSRTATPFAVDDMEAILYIEEGSRIMRHTDDGITLVREFDDDWRIRSLTFDRQGYLLLGRAAPARDLWAVPYDSLTGTSEGATVRIAERVNSVSVGNDGSLWYTYFAGASFEGDEELVLYDRSGEVVQTLGLFESFDDGSGTSSIVGRTLFSPDGTKLATSTRTPGGTQIWLFDLETGSRQLIDERGFDERAFVSDWLADGSALLLSTDAGLASEMTILSLDSLDLVSIGQGIAPKMFGEDRVAFLEDTRVRGRWRVGTLDGDGPMTSVEDLPLEPGRTAWDLTFSPDAQMAAYAEIRNTSAGGFSRTLQITAMQGGGTWRVEDGSSAATWSTDSRRLFYWAVDETTRLRALDVDPEIGPDPSSATTLLEFEEDDSNVLPGRLAFDVNPDATRFAAVRIIPRDDIEPFQRKFVMVQNWAKLFMEQR